MHCRTVKCSDNYTVEWWTGQVMRQPHGVKEGKEQTSFAVDEQDLPPEVKRSEQAKINLCSFWEQWRVGERKRKRVVER